MCCPVISTDVTHDIKDEILYPNSLLNMFNFVFLSLVLIWDLAQQTSHSQRVTTRTGCVQDYHQTLTFELTAFLQFSLSLSGEVSCIIVDTCVPNSTHVHLYRLHLHFAREKKHLYHLVRWLGGLAYFSKYNPTEMYFYEYNPTKV